LISNDFINASLSRMAWRNNGTLDTVPGSTVWLGQDVDVDTNKTIAVATIVTWPIPHSDEIGAMGTLTCGATVQKLLPQQAQHGVAKAATTTTTTTTTKTPPSTPSPRPTVDVNKDDFDTDAIEEG
jgi:hypothetical protein